MRSLSALNIVTALLLIVFAVALILAGLYGIIALNGIEKKLSAVSFSRQKELHALVLGMSRLDRSVAAFVAQSSETNLQELLISLDVAYSLLKNSSSTLSTDGPQSILIVFKELEELLSSLDAQIRNSSVDLPFVREISNRLDNAISALSTAYLNETHAVLVEYENQKENIRKLQASRTVMFLTIASSLAALSFFLYRLYRMNIGLELEVSARTKDLKSELERRQQAESHLIESERLYRELVDNTPNFIFSINGEDRISAVNRSLCEVLKASPESLIGKSLREVVLFERLVEHLDELKRRLASAGDRAKIEAEIPVSDSNRTYEFIITPIACENCDAVGYRIVADDITERRLAEKRLREHEAILRSFFESPGVMRGVVEIIADDVLHVEANKYAAAFFGTSPESMRNKLSSELNLPEGTIKLWVDRYEETRRTGNPVQFEYPHKIGDHERWISATASYIGDFAEGQSRYAYVTFDMTEQRKAEQILRESEERFQNAFSFSSGGMALVTPEGRFLKVNASFCDMLGYTEKELLDTDLQSITFAEDRERGLAYAKRMLSGEIGSFKMEKRYVHKKGHIVWALLSAAAVKDQGDRVLYLIVQTHDISGLKKAEEELRHQLHWLEVLNSVSKAISQRSGLESILRVVMRHLEEYLPFAFAGITIFDKDAKKSRIGVVSSRGKRKSIAIGMVEENVIPEDLIVFETNMEPDRIRKLYLSEMEKAVSSEDGGLLIQNLKKEGISIMLLIPLAIAELRIGSVAMFFKEDIALSRYEESFLNGLAENISLAAQNTKLYENLEASYTELKASRGIMTQQERMNAMGQMASGIAHDINNTLAPITLYTEALLESEQGLSDRAKRFLSTIQSAVGDIESTTMRLRAFYRKGDESEFRHVDVSELFDQVVSLTRPRWKDIPNQRGVVIRMETEIEDKLLPILANESEVREALINLIFNSVDAMPEGGMITLKAEIREPYVILEVSDSGKGMTEEQKRKCLEPFYTTKGEKGTGLGLAAVFGVVKRHEGTLEIESLEGKGTSVRLLFPMRNAERVEPNTVDEHIQISLLRILCVDDDKAVREALAEILESDGHSVRTYADGKEALEAFRAGIEEKTGFDLVITDLGMPHMDGKELARHIKKASPSTPVILLSGWGNYMNLSREAPKNIDCVLGKPPRIGKLREAMRHLLSQ